MLILSQLDTIENEIQSSRSLNKHIVALIISSFKPHSNRDLETNPISSVDPPHPLETEIFVLFAKQTLEPSYISLLVPLTLVYERREVRPSLLDVARTIWRTLRHVCGSM